MDRSSNRSSNSDNVPRTSARVGFGRTFGTIGRSTSVSSAHSGGGAEAHQDFRSISERASLLAKTSIPLTINNKKNKYHWTDFAPKLNDGILQFMRWVVGGGNDYALQSDEELHSNLAGLSECLILLRDYHERYGMPFRGGPRDQELVIREVYKDLYAGGAPIWALGPIVQKAFEGMSGHDNVSILSLPRTTFLQDPVAMTTSLFDCERGFDISKMDDMEPVAVRLASFATNTSGPNVAPTRVPNTSDLYKAHRRGGVGGSERNITVVKQDYDYEYEGNDLAQQEQMAQRILDLASTHEGIFHFAHLQELPHTGTANVTLNSTKQQEELDKRTEVANRWALMEGGQTAFWTISQEDRELFSRLATIEALRSIEWIDNARRQALYAPWLMHLFRLLSAATACGFWFQGSWIDMLVAGSLSMVVALVGTIQSATKQERIVMEIVASFTVGLTAGLIALKFPGTTCFSAMALGGVLDIFQGFRVVYAVIQVMSKNTVAGGADLLEGILFTGLIAYFLRFGQYVASSVLADPDTYKFDTCQQSVSSWWYPVLVPIAAVSWSGLFNPNYSDLPVMALHGIMAYGVNYGLSNFGVDTNLNNFISSLLVSFTAGVVSRFTGKQAVANTVAAIYALVPGSYMVTALLSTGALDNRFLTTIIQRSVIIGLGAWTGSIMCSPTLLGSTEGFLGQSNNNDGLTPTTDSDTMLYF